MKEREREGERERERENEGERERERDLILLRHIHCKCIQYNGKVYPLHKHNLYMHSIVSIHKLTMYINNASRHKAMLT